MHDQDKLAISTRQAPEGGNDKSSDPLRGTPYRFVRKLSDGAMGEVVDIRCFDEVPGVLIILAGGLVVPLALDFRRSLRFAIS